MKSISPATLVGLVNNQISMAILFKLDMVTHSVRYNTLDRPIYWDENGLEDHEYLGVGALGNLTTSEESSDIAPISIQASLSGIPVNADGYDFYNDILNVKYRNKKAYIYLAILDDDCEIVGSPVNIFSGRVDTATVDIGDTATITLNIISRLTDWERPRGGNFSNGYQQTYVDPTDKGFEYIPQLADIEIVWGGEDDGEDKIGRTKLG